MALASVRRSFAIWDRVSSLWRTFRDSLDGEWETFSETWPASGMTRNGTAYQLPSSVPPIYATESGSLPTPSATDYGSNQSPSPGAAVRPSLQSMARTGMWPTPKGSAANYGRPRDNDRGDLQAAVMRWPTPQARDHRTGEPHRVGDPARHGGWNLNDWAAMWPTPQAHDSRPGHPERVGRFGTEHGRNLNDEVGGQLNPTWVEWLMGYPAGWTDSEDSATP